jgi:hypothetical protein
MYTILTPQLQKDKIYINRNLKKVKKGTETLVAALGSLVRVADNHS